ncbi:MAG: hypothetical protein WB804_02400 [Candidatus Dormiibacterota bacterium]
MSVVKGARRRRQVTAALLAAVAAGATDGGYLAIIHSQDATPPVPGVVPFVAGYVGAIAAVLLSAAAGNAALRLPCDLQHRPGAGDHGGAALDRRTNGPATWPAPRVPVAGFRRVHRDRS